MSQVSKSIVLSRGGVSLLYPPLPVTRRRRPRTFKLRDRWRSGTRAWMHCKSSRYPSDLLLKASFNHVQPSSCLTICLYAKRSSHPDIPIGTHEMQIPLATQSGSFCSEFPFVQSAEHLACRYPLCPSE